MPFLRSAWAALCKKSSRRRLEQSQGAGLGPEGESQGSDVRLDQRLTEELERREGFCVPSRGIVIKSQVA